LKTGCNVWAPLKIVIMWVNSAVEPPTFLDSVPKTDSSPQPPALSLGRDLVHADLGALSELGLVCESLDTVSPSPHLNALTGYWHFTKYRVTQASGHGTPTARWTVRGTPTRGSGRQRFRVVYQPTMQCVTIRTVSQLLTFRRL